MEQPVMLQSVIPFWERENGKIKSLELLPIMIESKDKEGLQGLPQVTEDNDFMWHLAKISEPYGTKIQKIGYIYKIV